MKVSYKNRYGELEIETVGEFLSVESISSEDVPECFYFSLDDAERIALISENRGIQLCVVSRDHTKMFLIFHDSPSIAAVCRVDKLAFDSKVNATNELARKSPWSGVFGIVGESF